MASTPGRPGPSLPEQARPAAKPGLSHLSLQGPGPKSREGKGHQADEAGDQAWAGLPHLPASREASSSLIRREAAECCKPCLCRAPELMRVCPHRQPCQLPSVLGVGCRPRQRWWQGASGQGHTSRGQWAALPGLARLSFGCIRPCPRRARSGTRKFPGGPKVLQCPPTIPAPEPWGPWCWAPLSQTCLQLRGSDHRLVHPNQVP